MLPLEIIGVTHSSGIKKDGTPYNFSRVLVSLGDAWYEVFVQGSVDLQKGDTAVFDLAVQFGKLQLVYTGQKA